MVEFVLILPILLLLFAAAADLGRVFYTFVAIENAAKEGAIYGARAPLCDNASTLCPDPANVAWRTRSETTNVIPTANLTVTSACLDGTSGVAHADLRNCEPGDVYRVTASTPFKLMTPIIGALVGSNFTLSSTSNASVLNLAFDPTPGVGPVKLVLATSSRNRAEITSNCTQPDPTGSPGFYRSPCLNESTGVTYPIKFRSGDTITYRIIARNNGGTNLTSVTMDDSLGWPSPCSRPTFLPTRGSAYVCTYTRLAPTDPGGAVTMDFTNIFTVDADEILATTDGATVTVEKPPADLRVLKFVSPYREGNDGDGTPSFGIIDTITVGRTAAVSPVYVWYKLIVQNVGGQPAAGLTITDTNGPVPFGTTDATTDCEAAPVTLAVNAFWTCRYRVSYNTSRVVTNTVQAAATGVTTGSDDSHTARVRIRRCPASRPSVPDMIGLTEADARTAWTAAGFTGTLTPWTGGSGATTTVTQNRRAFTCMPRTTTVTITSTPTP